MPVTLPSPCVHVGSPPAGTGLPRRAGAGFKPQHTDAWLADPSPASFFEVHAENYMGVGGMDAGGAPHAALARMRERAPLSLHGVGLSIGGEDAPDPAHLNRLACLIERYQPEAFSEHLAWSTHAGNFLGDLLPLTYDACTLDRVCAHVDLVQSRLRVRLLLENPSTYFEFEGSDIDEPEFITRIVARTGCGLLLDINNVYVSCRNNHRDPFAYLGSFPLPAVGEIHLAGHAQEIGDDGAVLLVDNHGGPVAAAVWDLYAWVLAATGPVATLIEWDHDVPAYPRLRAEARRADRMLGAAQSAQCAVAA